MEQTDRRTDRACNAVCQNSCTKATTTIVRRNNNFAVIRYIRFPSHHRIYALSVITNRANLRLLYDTCNINKMLAI